MDKKKKMQKLLFIILPSSALLLAVILLAAVLLLSGLFKFNTDDKPPALSQTADPIYKGKLDNHPLKLNINWVEQKDAVVLKDSKSGELFFKAEDVAKGLGGACTLAGNEMKITIGKDKITLLAGSTDAAVNNKRIKLDVQPMMSGSDMVLNEASMKVVFGARASSLIELYAYNISTVRSECELKKYMGRRVFYINGNPSPASFYQNTVAGNASSWTTEGRAMYKQFTDAGYNIVGTDMRLGWLVNRDEKFDVNLIRKTLGGYLAVNGNSNIIIRFDTSAPEW